MSDNVQLREVTQSDLPVFFEQQLDPDANFMAAFTAKDPTDREAFDSHWARILADGRIKLKTILFDDQVAGYIVRHYSFGKPEISYWLGKEFWGQGIVTEALTQFLEQLETRPLFARVVKDNAASVRVLQKCGFLIIGTSEGFANGRQTEVEEFILRLD